MIDRVFLNRLRLLGIVEGISTLVLFFVAMPLKYFAGFPLAVTIAGSIHGFLFVALLLMLFLAVERVPISNRLALGGAFGAIIPFGPFVTEIWLKRLADGDASAPAPTD